MIPTIAVAPATMAVKIHVLLAWTVMESGREAIGTQRTAQPAGTELSRTNLSTESPTLTSLTVPGTTPPAVVFSDIVVGKKTALRSRPRSAIATSSIHHPPRVGMFPEVALNRT